MIRWILPLQELRDGFPTRDDGAVPAYAEVARALEDVLAGPDFRRAEPSMVEIWLIAAWEALQDVLRMIPLRIPEGGGAAAAWLLAVVLVVVSAAVLAVLLGRWVARLSNHRDGRRGGAVDDSRSAQPTTAAEWMRLAAARTADGDLRSAATALYQGVLRVLDGKGMVRFHPSKTPGEYIVEAVRHGGEPGADAAAFLRSFQRFRFGEAAPTLAAYRELEERARLDEGERV